MNYLTHDLYILPSKYKYGGFIYKCKTCEIILYGFHERNIFFYVREIINNNELLNVDMFNQCNILCTEYIIKNIID